MRLVRTGTWMIHTLHHTYIKVFYFRGNFKGIGSLIWTLPVVAALNRHAGWPGKVYGVRWLGGSCCVWNGELDGEFQTKGGLKWDVCALVYHPPSVCEESRTRSPEMGRKRETQHEKRKRKKEEKENECLLRPLWRITAILPFLRLPGIYLGGNKAKDTPALVSHRQSRFCSSASLTSSPTKVYGHQRFYLFLTNEHIFVIC